MLYSIKSFIISKTFFKALPLLIFLSSTFEQYLDYMRESLSTKPTQNGKLVYDFIVVGGGSSGSVIVNRLTQQENYTVLLLEAGGYPSFVLDVPFFAPVGLFGSSAYEYYTVPQKNCCLAMHEQRSYWPRGRGLGGTSNINFMIYQRSHRNDYNEWAKHSGSDEWKYENVLKNFENNEDRHSVNKKGINDTQKSSVFIGHPPEARYVKEFIQAGEEAGYPHKDINEKQEASFGFLDVNVKNGVRDGGYNAFLKPALNRKNLYIKLYAKVTKINFDVTKKAYGVTYFHHGKKLVARAKKEIILAAGAIDTPKILMLSGVGPENHLKDLGIKPIADLPVGKNLQDHIMVSIGPFITRSQLTTINVVRDTTMGSIFNYYVSKVGILSSPIGVSAVAYIYSELAKKRMQGTKIRADNLSPDIQLLLWPMLPGMHSQIEKNQNIRDGYIQKYFGSVNPNDGFYVNVMLGKYKSRGILQLSGTNFDDNPVIDPMYFSHNDDIKALVQGINFTVTFIENSKAFRQQKVKLLERAVPGCEKYTFKSILYYECLARHLTQTVFHPSGTCKMGKASKDLHAVVDPELQVLQTKGLRIADASVIPEIPNGNINAAVYMIADKASKMVLRSWKK